MNEELNKAYYRNSVIMRMIKKDTEENYKDKVDLIIIDPYVNCPQVYGTQGFNMIAITEDENFHDIDKNFLVKQEYFSIFAKTWKDIENASHYENPDVFILKNFSAIYKKDTYSWLRYISYFEKLEKNIQNESNNTHNISKHFVEILKLYDQILNTLDFRKSFNYLSQIITRCEYIVYMLNKRTFPKEISSIQTTAKEFEILPHDFEEIYDDMLSSYSLNEIRKSSLNMIVKIKNLLDDLGIQYQRIIREKQETTPNIRVPLTSDALTGTCELIFGKWRKDMYRAIIENNKYLSFMTMAKCQRLYTQMYKKYEMINVDILPHYDPNNLRWNAKVFDQSLISWQQFYKRIGKIPENYQSILEFENYYNQKSLKLKK